MEKLVQGLEDLVVSRRSDIVRIWGDFYVLGGIWGVD